MPCFPREILIWKKIPGNLDLELCLPFKLITTWKFSENPLGIKIYIKASKASTSRPSRFQNVEHFLFRKWSCKTIYIRKFRKNISLNTSYFITYKFSDSASDLLIFLDSKFRIMCSVVLHYFKCKSFFLLNMYDSKFNCP